MKRNLILSVLVFSVLLFLQSFNLIHNERIDAVAGTDSACLVTDGKVGRLEINMDVLKLKNIFPEERMKVKNTSSDGDEYATYKIFEEDNKTLALEIESLCADICLVSLIKVVSPKYKTLAGIGVGSTFADIKKNYTMKNIVGGEDNNFMIYVKEFADIAFLVRSSDNKPKLGKPYGASDILNTDIISKIYIF